MSLFYIIEVGIIARFLDKLNNVWIELFTGKIPEPPKVKERGRTLEHDDTFYSKTESSSNFYIVKNHLKGHARILSEGAVARKRTYLEEDEYLFPSKTIITKTFRKSPSCKF